MPRYLYENLETGEIESHVMGVEEHDTCGEKGDGTWLRDGAMLQRRLDLEHGARENVSARNWPMECDAMGVHPDQIPEAMEADRKLGINTRYNPKTGACIYENKRQRDRHIKAHGYYDRAGYN